MNTRQLLQGVTTLTFDCYGTLVDWESGILSAVRSVFGPSGPSDPQILEAYAQIEAKLEASPGPAASSQPPGHAHLLYREVLTRVMRELASRFGVSIDHTQAGAIARSLPSWRAFPDTLDALHRLRSRFKLGVISNIDDDLFEGTRRTNALPIDWVVTAQQCRSYKPSLNNFRAAMAAQNLSPETMLHVAESLYHDIAPCRELGIRCVWVHRRAGREGFGATHPASATPDLRVVSLAELADVLGV